MSQPLRALISGASIAGPATAHWLAKAGAKVTVIERHPSLRPGGQAIDIRTSGVSVMRKISGMEDQVRAKSTREVGVSLVREDGRPYGVIRATGDPDQQALVSEYEIFRGDLAAILFELTSKDENIEYVFDEQIASMRSSHQPRKNGPVTVEFKNRLKTSDYDLVVACDGATSRTRAKAFNCGVRDHVIPTNSWAAYFSLPEDLLTGSNIGQGFSAPGGRFISLGPDPTGGNKALLMCVSPNSAHDATRPFREAAAQGDHALKAYISHHYRDVGWKTQTILNAMTHSPDFYASEIVQVKVPTLSKGPIALVGDAGYAAGPTGNSTSLALTGSYILAGEITKQPGNLAAALQNYERQMRPIIQELQKIPPFVSRFAAPQTAAGIWLRNNAFAVVAKSGVVGFLQRYLGAAFAGTGTFPLPEYDWVR